MDDKRIDEILDFWFGAARNGGPISEEMSKKWFGKNPDFDAEIRKKFEGLFQEAKAGTLTQWDTTPNGCLALILLLDQFSRNMYRDTPEMYAQDRQALRLALRGVERGFDRRFKAAERVFFYLPMEHSENIQIQEKCLTYLSLLAKEADEHEWEFVDASLDFAINHRDVIERFGRFPHRNKVLGRESTPEEEEFLTEPGTGF